MIDHVRKWVRPGTVLAFVLFLLTGGYIAGFAEMLRPGAGFTLINLQKDWLNAIPENAYNLFGAAIIGYFGAREVGKWAERKFVQPPEKPDDEII